MTASRDAYRAMFQMPWSDRLRVTSGNNPGQVEINGQLFAAEKLVEALKCYLLVDDVRVIKIDCNTAARARSAMTEIASVLTMNMKYKPVRKIKINLHKDPLFDIALLLQANRITSLQLKEVSLTNPAYVHAHFEAIRVMAHLREFTYKLPERLLLSTVADVNHTPVAQYLERAVANKRLTRFSVAGIHELTGIDAACILNGLGHEPGMLTVKIKNCRNFDPQPFGAALDRDTRLSLAKLELHTEGQHTDSPPPSYSSLQGLLHLRALKLCHDPPVSDVTVSKLVHQFRHNIIMMHGFKDGTGFKLGVRAGQPDVYGEAMMWGLIERANQYANSRYVSRKPDYTWFCTLFRPVPDEQLPNPTFRLKVHLP